MFSYLNVTYLGDPLGVETGQVEEGGEEVLRLGAGLEVVLLLADEAVLDEHLAVVEHVLGVLPHRLQAQLAVRHLAQVPRPADPLHDAGVEFNVHLGFQIQIWDKFRDNFSITALQNFTHVVNCKRDLGQGLGRNSVTKKVSIELHPSTPWR